jgi:hypothetical protein
MKTLVQFIAWFIILLIISTISYYEEAFFYISFIVVGIFLLMVYTASLWSKK